MNSSDYTVETIETLEDFENTRGDWERLFNLKGEIPIFFSFEVFKIYYETILDNFNNVQMKTFIVKNRNKKIVAIFPFTLETTIYYYLLPIKELSLKDDYLIGFYNFLIDSKENCEMIFKSITDYLKKGKGTWDIIKFYHIPESEELFKNYKSVLSTCYKTKKIDTETLVIEDNGEFDKYVKNDMEKKTFIGIKRVIRRLNERGRLKLVEIKAGEIEKGLTYLYDVEDKNWKGEKETSLKRTHQGDFYRKLAFYLSKENNIRIYLLQLNDEVIAGIYVIIDKEICFLVKGGYNEKFYQFSPSKILFYLLFKKLFDESKIKKIDFFGDYYPWEKSFGRGTRKKCDFFVYNNRFIVQIYLIFKKILTHLKQEST